MCLAKVDPVKPKPNGFGYKVFRVEADGLHSAFMDTLNPWRQWVTASIAGRESGFHIYRTREQAERCVRWYDAHYGVRPPQERPNFQIFKVEYRNATKQGVGDGGFTKNARVIVAQEIFIL
jgi:hypothetical protein